MRRAIFALALVPLPAWAEDTPNIAPLHGQDGAVARLLEAHRLQALGKDMRDPVLLMAAARLMQGVTLREVTRTEAGPAEPKPDAKKKKTKEAPTTSASAPVTATVVPDPARQAPLPGTLDAKALMEAARAMAPEGAILRDAIADAESETPPPGPVAEVTSMIQDAGGATTFALPLAGNSYAEIGLLRLGEGHLVLKVTDAAGNPVCLDASAGPTALCGVVPRESGGFLVTITNDGGVSAPYLLVTN